MSKSLKFDDLEPKLSDSLLRIVREDFKFTHMTPVQAASIPLFLKNKDVCVEACTGSGKTLAFGIPIVELLRRPNIQLGKYDIGALVLAPTRELADQIYDIITKLAHPHSLRCVLCVGGINLQENKTNYLTDGGQIIIGTPGRVKDMFTKCDHFHFNKLEVLVLDEADTLLDMGFKDTINEILSALPKQRRTGLFSATQTNEVKDLARAGLRNPVTISVKISNSQGNKRSYSDMSDGNGNILSAIQSSITPQTLENYYCLSEYDMRPARLMQFLLNNADKKIIVFCATCACVDHYALVYSRLLKKYTPQTFYSSQCDSHGHNADVHLSMKVLGLHGKMIPKKRKIVYKKFISLSNGILFSTDVAARGVDIPSVDWIIQLHAPKDPSFFVHRVGRTARAGRRGQSLLFITTEEFPYIALLHGRGVPLMEMMIQSVELDRDGDLSKAVIKSDNHNNIDDDESIETNEESTDSDEEEVDCMDINDEDVETSPSPKLEPKQREQYIVDANIMLTAMQQLAVDDRIILENGSTAFMSFLRSYQEHLCSFIFKFSQLDIGSVARAYALLRLPKIPETRGVKGKPIIFQSSEIDTASIKYKHQEKEKARQRKIQSWREQADADVEEDDVNSEEGVIAGDAGSKIGGASAKTFKSMKTLKSGKSVKTAKSWVAPEFYVPQEEIRNRGKRKSKQQSLAEEWEDWQAEETAYKKFKKGKLSKADYENCLMSENAPLLDMIVDDDDDNGDDDDGDENSRDDDNSDVHDEQLANDDPVDDVSDIDDDFHEISNRKEDRDKRKTKEKKPEQKSLSNPSKNFIGVDMFGNPVYRNKSDASVRTAISNRSRVHKNTRDKIRLGTKAITTASLNAPTFKKKKYTNKNHNDSKSNGPNLNQKMKEKLNRLMNQKKRVKKKGKSK